MELLSVQAVDEAVTRAAHYFEDHWKKEVEQLPLLEALGRRLADDVISREDVPNFTRSTVDGYAVYAADTQGASEALPALLIDKGAVQMGENTNLVLKPGETAYVPTGGMLPQGANAMVMVEYCEDYQIGDIAIGRAVAVGDGVLTQASDLSKGSRVMKRNRRLTAYDLAGLAAIGISQVPVWKKPRVSVFSSGDELVSIDDVPGIGQIRDSNGYGIAAQASERGWCVVKREHLRDDAGLYREQIQEAMKMSDMVVVSGGSSKGRKDFTLSTFATLGEPGIMTHGIAMKPGKPTIFAGAEGTLLVGLPGHPVSAMLVFDVFLDGLDDVLFGGENHHEEKAILTENIAGSPGQNRVIPANLFLEEGVRKVSPRHGKSGQLSVLIESNALILLPRHSEGARVGDEVRIRRTR